MIFCSACKDEQEKIKPTIVDITESVYASITIQPENKYLAYAAVSGIVSKVMVEEGEDVKKGQPLFQVENDNSKLNAENARLAYNLANENLRGNESQLIEIVNAIQSARLKLTNDSINYMRQKNLWENNIGTKYEYDQRKLAYETSRNELSTLRSKYGQMQNQLQTQLRQAQNNYRSSLNTAKDFTIKSEIDGRVYDIKKDVGEVVLPQEPLAMLGQKNRFIIEMRIDEVDIAKISLGQKVLVRLDAYNQNVFEAVVSKIIPSMDLRSQTFTVEASFLEKPEVLYPGLTGEANIVIAQKQKALTIPYDYLFDGNKIMTVDGEVTVKTGLKNFERVEIISGLDTSQYILKPVQ